MNKGIGLVIMSLIILSTFGVSSISASSIIVINDANLNSALCKQYNHNGNFTLEDAGKLSNDIKHAYIDNSNISDLEGLQYFIGLRTIYVGGNHLSDLKPLSKLSELTMLDISNNSFKGKKFEIALNTAGCINNLETLNLDNNGITSIKFLDKIGNINNFTVLSMRDNKISEISILKDAASLYTLDLNNNRITDVSPLKNLEKLTFCIDLRNNCIIDYKPIKPLLDKMWEDFDDGMDRYDYYTNPVNNKYNGKTIKFPYLTTYYKSQGYAEAVPLFKALGGSAQYDKDTGTLTCKYNGVELIFKDFSKSYTLNGKKKSMKFEMRRMQYDLAYVPVKDICNILGLDYNVTKTRWLEVEPDEFEEAPVKVEIRKAGNELG